MVKLRNAYYCNLKLLLIFLVVFGHCIEPEIGSEPRLYGCYRLIYLFHMPLFSFLSGLFVRSAEDCTRQLRRMGRVYLLCQGTAVLVGAAQWHTPWWILWYLLSMCVWLAAAAVFLRLGRGKWLLLVLSLAAGCLVGAVPWVGRSWSMSRSVVFFPYFWLGVLLDPGVPWHRFRFPGALALAAALIFCPEIPVTVLYHAGPCDPSTRLVCYALAAALGLFVLSWCPRRRFPWTRAGADTMAAYLLHAPLVRLLPSARHPVLFTLAFLYITHKLTSWYGVYGIIGKEACPWPDLNNFTKNRPGRSIASSWP